jgi:hypothetical protein
MISETSIIDFGGSLYVRIPFTQVKFYEAKPGKCMIEDLSKDEAKLVFR